MTYNENIGIAKWGFKVMISTKGRYALRVMIDLAENSDDGWIPLREIAKRQEISEKYLETILKMLVGSNLVTGMRGKGGGYRLNRAPEDYSAGEILRCTEGSLAPVSCLELDSNTCPRKGDCRTLPMWKELDQIITNYLDGVTIADLMQNGDPGDNYVI